MSNKDVEKQYDILASTGRYHEARSSYDKLIGRTPLLVAVELLRLSFPNASRLRMIDVGCGLGHDMLWFPQLVETVYGSSLETEAIGCDISGEMVRACQGQGLNVLEGDVLDLLAELGLAHLVWAHHSLIHLRRRVLPRYLRALHKATRSAGLCTIAFKTGDDVEREDPADDRIPVPRFTSFHRIKTIELLATGVGFEVKTSLEIPASDPSYTYGLVYAQKGEDE